MNRTLYLFLILFLTVTATFANEPAIEERIQYLESLLKQIEQRTTNLESDDVLKEIEIKLYSQKINELEDKIRIHRLGLKKEQIKADIHQEKEKQKQIQEEIERLKEEKQQLNDIRYSVVEELKKKIRP